MNHYPITSPGCQCMNWCRDGSKYWTDHHVRCEHHTPGQIVVWKISDDSGTFYYEHNIWAAAELVANEGLKKEAMRVDQSEYEALPEFAGF